MAEIKAVRGFEDILPEDIPLWRWVEEEARKVLESFGFKEIRIPVLEKAELFTRGIGEETDIVQKEMYTFQDKGGDWVTLRPEATASIARAYIEHRLYAKDPEARLYFIGPMFRYERPQKGRLRQFHQIDAEVFGVDHPMVDAEVMGLCMEMLGRVGVTTVRLELNSLGCDKCRPIFRRELKAFLQSRLPHLCPDCQRRADRNPLRALDCKLEGCKAVMAHSPLILDYLCEDCQAHFQAVKTYLEELSVPYVVNPYLVRGLDYYDRTAFEVLSEDLGAQKAVAAGGRYNHLISQLGGPEIPGIGFAIGMERLILLLRVRGERPPLPLFLIALGERAKREVFRLSWQLKKNGILALMEYQEKSLKSQLRRADKLGAQKVVVIGDEELAKGVFLLKDMKTGLQEEFPLQDALRVLKERLLLDKAL